MNGEVAAKPSASSSPPAGILVTSNSGPKQVTGIKWDEAVIAEHDLLRGTRAPILEPKTPYNRERIDNLEDEEQPGPVDPSELAARLAQLQEGDDSQQMLEEAQQQAFRERRKQHYNEFIASKQRLQELADEDADEDDE